MEKFGMDRKCAGIWTGLLVSLLLSISLFAQTDAEDDSGLPDPFSKEFVPSEEIQADQREIVQTPSEEQAGLFIEVIFLPEQPIVNMPWTISILVDYPYPEYLGVNPPVFPEILHLDEMRIEPLIREGRRRWTAVRWTFIPQGAESEEIIHLDSFQITAPGKTAFTEAIDVPILSRYPSAKNYYPRLVWDKIQTPFEVGVSGSLFLRLLDWNPSLTRPKIGIVAPEQAILEEIPLTQEDRARSVILRLSLIPLSYSEVTIPRVHFKSEGVNLDIPALTIPVVPSVKGTVSPQTPKPIAIADIDSPSTVVQFPPKALKIPKVFSQATAGIVSQAEILWEHGERAEALALVRKNERDSIFGFVFASLRRDMEQALGLIPSHDETWIPKRICLIAIFCCLAGLIVVLLKRRPKRAGENVFFASVLIALAIGCPVGVWIFSQQKTAVFHTSDVYSVPELKGTVTGRINDGQWAILHSIYGDWALAESDNLSGWILLEKAVFY
ncbi:MAG: hypothetical protein LBH75_04020 [Treponema sp.]|jgi:hypothetical protein|nr:hypothetical protein [Treponema sp.]